MSEKQKIKFDDIFPNEKELKSAKPTFKRYTESDGTQKNIPSSPPRNIPIPSKRGRPPKAVTEAAAQARDEILLEKDKKELFDILFKEDKDLVKIDNQINKYVSKMPKTTSALKGIREMLEDKLQIHELVDLIKINRDKAKNNPDSDDQEQGQIDVNSLVSFLPLLQKMQNGGLDYTKLDPTTLAMAMASQGGGRNQGGLGQLFFMLSMANMFNQQKPNGTTVANPNINTEIIKNLYSELQNIMQQQQRPVIDPQTLLLTKLMNQNQGAGNQSTQLILDKMSQMMANNQTQQLAAIMSESNTKFKEAMEMVASALHQNPEDKLLKTFKVYKEIQGDSTSKTDSELNYQIESKKLDIEEAKLKRLEEREMNKQLMDDQKSLTVVNGIGKAIDSVMKHLGSGVSEGIVNITGRNLPKTSNPGETNTNSNLQTMDNIEDLDI